MGSYPVCFDFQIWVESDQDEQDQQENNMQCKDDCQRHGRYINDQACQQCDDADSNGTAEAHRAVIARILQGG